MFACAHTQSSSGQEEYGAKQVVLTREERQAGQHTREGIGEKVSLEYFCFLSSVSDPLQVHIWELGKGKGT